MKKEDTENLEIEKVEVRVLHENDLKEIIKIDEENTGFRREHHLTKKFNDCLQDSSILVSLVAIIEDRVAGFIMGDVYYGAFGRVEKSVSISSLAIDPNHSGKGVGTALLRQFISNIKALKVNYVETLVDWNQNFDLLGFFRASGFEPGKRLHLSVRLDDE